MRNLYRVASVPLIVIPCLLLALSAAAQQSTAPASDAAQSAPEATPGNTPATPAQKPAKKKEGKKKENKKAASASGPPTALCGDGTYSHDKPTAGKGGKGGTPCKANGGVSHYF